jgi:hypothetical protein
MYVVRKLNDSEDSVFRMGYGYTAIDLRKEGRK